MVVGDDPKAVMENYSIDKKVEPYVKYKFLQAEKYKNTAIKVSEKLLEDASLTMMNPQMKQALEENVKRLKTLSTFDYYRQLTDGMYYDESGNALSDKNPNGKWKTSHIGRNFSLPLITFDGREVYTAKVRDVDWSRMHLVNQETYRAAWEVVVEGREPENEQEEKIYNSMKDKDVYFSKFPDKESYVNYSTAYWNFGYVDSNGWVDMTGKDEYEWINGFYEKLVKNLSPEDTVSIYECTINDDD
jgi:hypothetical protein